MKFNAKLTSKKSEIAGLDMCRQAATNGEIERIVLGPVSREVTSEPAFWERMKVSKFRMEGESNSEAGELDAEGMYIKVREPVLEELTRHTQTAQAFMPCDGPIFVPVAASMQDDLAQPDPRRVRLVPCVPGEVVVIAKGVWHTLPFSSIKPVEVLTVVSRLPLGVYHDVRDLPAEGWYCEFVWENC